MAFKFAHLQFKKEVQETCILFNLGEYSQMNADKKWFILLPQLSNCIFWPIADMSQWKCFQQVCMKQGYPKNVLQTFFAFTNTLHAILL